MPPASLSNLEYEMKRLGRTLGISVDEDRLFTINRIGALQRLTEDSLEMGNDVSKKVLDRMKNLQRYLKLSRDIELERSQLAFQSRMKSLKETLSERQERLGEYLSRDNPPGSSFMTPEERMVYRLAPRDEVRERLQAKVFIRSGESRRAGEEIRRRLSSRLPGTYVDPYKVPKESTPMDYDLLRRIEERNASRSSRKKTPKKSPKKTPQLPPSR